MRTQTAEQNKSPPLHTPGPWRISGDHLGTKLLIEHGYSFQSIRSPFIASVYTDDGKLPQAANARLIAAAPDLLEALTLHVLPFLSRFPQHPSGNEREFSEAGKVADIVRAAIAKVRRQT